jgi:hypothetical protein
MIQIPGQAVWQANLILGGSDFVKYNCSDATNQGQVDGIYDKTKGVCRGNPLELYGVTVGYPGATGPIVSGNYYYGLTGSRTGCWFERTKIDVYDGVGAANVYNTDFYYRYWPHGYFGIDGQGCTFERPYKINGVTSDRWKFLITAKYGTAGDTASVNFGNYSNGVTGDVVYEEYKPPVIPAPVGHPLRVPIIPTITENDETRPLRVVDIECGAYHNIARLEDNTIMCWGLNSMGQCNVPDSLKAGITLGRHPKIDKICSIHAGFSTTAVLFNDGTAFCWGDPDVACKVNQWTDIRISPIKRHAGQQSTCCMGPGSVGYPDPLKPEYPSNKYVNGTYNANIDWFNYWHPSQTPAYPHFDLGVECNPIYPVNWNVTDTSYLTQPIQSGCNVFDPKSWCSDCAGMTIGKDFAVAMRRTGQIVTTRKENTPSAGQSLLYSRDCSTDAAFGFSAGFVNPGDRGLNYANTYFCGSSTFLPEGPNCSDPLDTPQLCRDFLEIQGVLTKCNSSYPCSAYDKWALPDNTWLNCNLVQGNWFSIDHLHPFIPEGIGCFSVGLGEFGYEPNWATSASIYTAGEQVRPSGFSGGLNPSWNTLNSSYGWDTLVAATGRYRLASTSNALVPPACQAGEVTTNRCVMNYGPDQACDTFCPSDTGVISPSMGTKGVPGIFRYPSHIASALTCVAGTNTVSWVSSAKLLAPDSAAAGVATNLLSETAKGRCEKYHLMDTTGLNHTPSGTVTDVSDEWQQGTNQSKFIINQTSNYVPQACSECGVVGGIPGEHYVEVPNTNYACIYASYPDATDINNPFYIDPYAQGCNIGPEQVKSGHGFPSRPWGPWNIETDIGFAAPNALDFAVCGRGLNATGVYVTYRSGSYDFGTNGLQNLPWEAYLGPGMPRWFMGACFRRRIFDSEAASANEPVVINNTVYGFSYPTALMYNYQFDPTTGGISLADNATAAYDCYTSTKTCACSPSYISFLWSGDTTKQHCGSDTKFLVELPERNEPGYPTTNPILNQVSGQQGFTCEAGNDDAISRWCWNNPIISYATGRSFAVHVRACPWVRGLSGEFIWADACQENNAYVNNLAGNGWRNSTSKQTKSLKMWVSGIAEDPCPPWPVDVNMDGITCGVYPAWVPVPTTNTDRRADKGIWTYTDTCTAAWGYTLGCETGWPTGITGCTGEGPSCATVL